MTPKTNYTAQRYERHSHDRHNHDEHDNNIHINNIGNNTNNQFATETIDLIVRKCWCKQVGSNLTQQFYV